MEHTKEKTKDRIIQELIDETWLQTMSEKSNLSYGQIQELDNLFSVQEGKYTYR
jgi:hypothetical protein